MNVYIGIFVHTAELFITDMKKQGIVEKIFWLLSVVSTKGNGAGRTRILRLG